MHRLQTVQHHLVGSTKAADLHGYCVTLPAQAPPGLSAGAVAGTAVAGEAALTPAERLHLEVHGYCVLPNVLNRSEIDALRAATYEIEEAFRGGEDTLAAWRARADPHGVTNLASTSTDYFNIENIPHLHQAFQDYVFHPRLLAIVQEIVGGRVRLEQSDAHIRRDVLQPAERQARRAAGTEPPVRENPGFHGGLRANLGRATPHLQHGLYHFSFVKTLTNLSDLSDPDDGGTLVIAGSHKINEAVDPEHIIEAAQKDMSLIHQVIAPAGSTLVFYESLIHASGEIRSGRDRPLVISGWSPCNFQPWTHFDPCPALLQRCNEEQRELLTGSRRWAFQPSGRQLGDEPPQR
eukprot:COSAG02_NODE_5606_length_4192_cov_4.811630_3_plen_350_part_00